MSLHMWIVPKPVVNGGINSIPNGTVDVPYCRYVNLYLAPGTNLHSGTVRVTEQTEDKADPCTQYCPEFRA